MTGHEWSVLAKAIRDSDLLYDSDKRLLAEQIEETFCKAHMQPPGFFITQATPDSLTVAA